MEVHVNNYLKYFILIFSVSYLFAVETIPASIQVIEDSSSLEANPAQKVETTVPVENEESKTVESPAPAETEMVPQEAPKAVSEKNERVQPTIVYVKETVPTQNQIIIEKASPSNLDIKALRNIYPIDLNLALAASFGSAFLANSENEGSDFSGLAWTLGLKLTFPLNEGTTGVVTGALFKYRYASAVIKNDRYRFNRMAVDVPLLFKFKMERSRLAFDAGLLMSVNAYDRLEISTGNKVTEDDLLKASYTNPVDWGFLTGFSVYINPRASFQFNLLFGVSEMYSVVDIKGVEADFTPFEISLGFSVVLF